MRKTIGNPLSWSASAVGSMFGHAVQVADSMGTQADASPPVVRTLAMADLRHALRKGLADMAAFRTDVVFAVLLYPIIGAILAALALRGDSIQMVFPVVSGFALVGPVASVGLYEMSRRREQGLPSTWLVFGDVMASPRFGSILALGLLLLGVFGVWLLVASAIFEATLGADAAKTVGGFAAAVLLTPAGWAMIVIGTAVGAVFAAAVLAVTVVSFPLLLDRDVGLAVAVATSVAVTRANPQVIAAWGFIVAVLLALGSLPLLLGLLLVMPVLGHATWHLYRAAVG